jgi:hypothetical protein
MRRFTIRALAAAAAAAGALLLTAGSAPGVASATVTPSAPIPTTSQAGYVATHNTFRFVTTTFKVPAASQHYTSYAEVVLGGTSGYPATLGVKAGGGAGSVQWNVVGPLGGMGGGTMKIAPHVGDTLTISIYNAHKAGRDSFTVADVTQGVTQTLILPPAPHQVYNGAEVACLLNGTVTAPKADVMLWRFTDSHVTTVAGWHGSMNGPWLTRQIVDVAADGHVVMSPSWLWNEGQNFGAWLRAAK